MAGAEVVGSIVGYLKLDADDFHREITRAIAEVKVLKGMDAKVHVEAKGSRSAERDLLKVGSAAKVAGRAAGGAGDAVGGLSDSFSGLTRGGIYSPAVIVGGLAAAVALLGPVTGAATAGVAGLTGVVGTGVLAFQGYKKEIEDGTALGSALQEQIGGLQSTLEGLSRTASSSMSGGVLAGLNDLNDYLPTLNDDVAMLSASLGRAFRTSTTGLISGLENAMPLLQDGGKYAEILAQKFADFTASQDFKDFVAYARRELPEVASAIGDLVVGVKDLAVALAPIGELMVDTFAVNGQAMTLIGKGIPVLNASAGSWGALGAAFVDTSSSADRASAALAANTDSAVAFANIQSPLAAGLGTTDAALAALEEKNRKAGNTANDATLAMQLQGDAAGLLKQQLDLLNGKSLNVAQAQTNAASATLGLTKSFKDNGTTLSTNTQKGIENRRAIEAKISADQALAEATAKATGSTKAGTESLKTSKGQLEDTLRSQGRLTGKVQAYIDKLYAIPKKVPPTKLEVQTAQGLASLKAFQTAIDKLRGKTVTATVRYAYEGRRPNGGVSTAGGQTFADGGTVRSRIPGYAGGTIIGPGSGRSDSILAGIAGTPELIRVSNGEFISTDASRRRNQAALEAANNGATLGVVGGAAGGKVDLSDASLHRLAAILSTRPIVTTVSSRQIDAALAAGI
ncbi:hypothetical protein [Phycicoccus avicenniae]|uniref:hypothetical protein n=1 Tax=Phycicoccus avicenniae TaxID=2828860 RepID=UPI003D2B7421